MCNILGAYLLTNECTNDILISETRKERKENKRKHLTRYKRHDIISAYKRKRGSKNVRNKKTYTPQKFTVSRNNR